MDKKTFIKELSAGLKGLSKEEKDDILSDYEEYFSAGKKEKRTEANIAKSLGKPKDIAKQLKAESAVKKAEEKKSAGNLMRAVFATVALGFFNLVIVTGPFFALLGVLIALFVSGIAITASGIAVVVAAIVAPSVGLIDLSAVSIIGAVFIGIGVFALGGLFLIGSYYVSKAFAKLTIAYLKFNIRLIKGK